MPIPPPSERPDLYDDFDCRPGPARWESVEYICAVTPDHIKRALEVKRGKPFIEIAEDMFAASSKNVISENAEHN